VAVHSKYAVGALDKIQCGLQVVLKGQIRRWWSDRCCR